jgi:hypothetical protein
MKLHVKKKKFQAMCREKVKQGLINDEKGNWVRYQDSGQNGRMHAMMRAGYKL